MPNPSDLLPPSPSDIWRAIRDLRRDLKELAAARRSERVGSMRVYTSTGTLILETGTLPDTHTDGSLQEGIRIYREDGSLVAAVQAQPAVTGTDRQAWTVYDDAGNAILGDDPIAGAGLAGPYVPIAFGRSWYLDWAGTNSSGFVDVYQTTIYKQHAMAVIQVAHSNDTSGATGQVRLTINGTATGSTINTTFSGGTISTIGPVALPGAHRASVDLRIQARLASGSGNARCEVQGAWSIKS
jgi:hypothetical protein